MNLSIYNTKTMKAQLLFSLLDGPAKAWATKFLANSNLTNINYAKFVEALKLAFNSNIVKMRHNLNYFLWPKGISLFYFILNGFYL